ncbi:MAG: molybdopterin-guanine dinucleotide biosynthesis protein MobA [Pseudoxanthomonas suwonensis]|nr:MAG: molybdopterin-guanine dinucleotide biosynthesis protein MobA [Pseudoxanthomonas suwonensis]
MHLPADQVTLGILAGGQGMRLGGIDKAWLQRDGEAQVLRLQRRLRPEVDAVLVSANRDLQRYLAHGLTAVPDRHAQLGPLGGLDALADAARTPWLLTVPVDVVDVNDCLLRSLAAAGGTGAFVVDADGTQPLLALWPVPELRIAAAQAIAERRLAVQALQQHMGMQAVVFPGFRLGNLNTPQDLRGAGVQLP